MPYIITTGPGGRFGYPADRPHPGDELTTSVAVATLDEAREAAFGHMATLPRYDLPHAAQLAASIHALPEAGDTIGPLPDGTVIKVRHVSWIAMRALAGYLPVHTHSKPDVIDAYNAR